MSLLHSWLKNTLKDKKRRNLLFVASAILIIAIIAVVTTIHGKNAKVGNLEAQKILDEAIASQREGADLLKSGKQEV